MIAHESNEQQRAIDAPYDECVAITGAPGTGKSAALRERIAHARELQPQADPLVLLEPHGLETYAVDLLNEAGVAVTEIDDVEAELLFAGACAPLFSLQWEEFTTNQLDPEVPGLRTPERFLESAFRLIRRLRDAGIDAATLLSRSLGGATEFYAKPPNFADPSLLFATRDAYHDSLDVTNDELQRQYRREVDLAKILARLYEAYVVLVERTGHMTGRDAILAASRKLREDGAFALRLRARHGFAFVDRAEDLTTAEMELLQTIFGEKLEGVTLCGDPSSAIATIRMTNPEGTFARAVTRVELLDQRRSPPAIDIACKRLLRPAREFRAASDPTFEVYRAATLNEEAAYIAEWVERWLRDGTPPEGVAVLMRSVRSAELYEAALLEREVPVAIVGDVNVFADRRSLDALALLWNVYDPFRHEWLLRTLANPAFALSDASLATLCSEPPDPQRSLFLFDDEPAPTTRPGRWDPKRDLRLGWNVIRGEQDAALGDDARRRIERLRALREGWLDIMHTASFETFARTVWREGLALEGTPGSARARTQQLVLRRLLARLTAFLVQHEGATVADVLEYAEERMQSDLESCEDDRYDGFVRLSSIEAAGGREFDRVVVGNVRAGAFPLWYAPDAFLFSPRLGMIPKENAGDARAARTAKFSYYMFRTKARERFNDRERRALVYALRRARKSALVTASGTPTRGITAPEFLEELR